MLYYILGKLRRVHNLARKQHFIRTTAVITLVILFSKALGFLRESITANYFGAGMESDAYVSAYSLFYLPILLFNSCITSTIVPLCIKIRKDSGALAEDKFASNALNLFILLSLVAAALMFMLAKPLVGLIYYGFDAEKAALTVRLTRIMMLTLTFNIASIVLSSLLNAHEKYVAAQLTGFPLSFALILASVFFSRTIGIEAMAWGVFFASILQTLVLIPFLRGSFHYHAIVNFRDQALTHLIAMALPAILSMAVSELNHMIDRMLCSGLNTGDLSCMNYAYKLITFLTGIIIVPLTTVMFSRMSQMVANKNTSGILKAVRSCIVMILLVMLPIVLVGAVMSLDVIKLAYTRGVFTLENARTTAGVLIFYIVGVPGFGIRDLLNRTFHAMQDTKTPFYAACVAVGLNVVLNILLRAVMGVNGLALATSIAGSLAMLMLLIQLKRRFGHIGLKKILPDILKIAFAGVLCAVVAMTANALLPAAHGFGMVFLRLFVVTLAAFLVYGAACLLLRVKAVVNRIK